MAHQLIESNTLSKCRLEMSEGLEIISRYRLLARLIEDELGPEAAGFLAEPVKNIDQDRINWYTDLSGEVLPFQSMNEEQKALARQALSGRAAEYAALAAGLKASRASNRIMAGELLERIAQNSDSYNLYMVGGQPVVVGWGLSIGERAEARPAAPMAKGGPAPPPPPAPPRRGCLFALWPLLLGLIIGLLLAWLLTRSFWPAFWTALDLYIKPPVLDEKAFDDNADREKDLRLELARLKEAYDARRLECRPPEPAPTPPPPAPEQAPAPPPEAPAEEEPPPNDDLQIPEDAAEKNDFSFMEGCWISDAGLFNRQTKQPINHIYCFDENGKASVKIEEKNSKGKHIDTCRTTAKASFEGRRLVIKQTRPAKCGKGGTYSPATIVCEHSEGGAAQCVIKQTSGITARGSFRRAR